MGIRSNLAKFPLPLNVSEFKATSLGARVLANSFFKSGTHLLTRVLDLLPLIVPRWSYHIAVSESQIPYQDLGRIRNGQYSTAHLYWHPELVEILDTHNIRTLFIIRDPRDIAVSYSYYITHMLRSHPLSPYFNSLTSDAERLMATIVGVDKNLAPDGNRWKSIGEHAIAYAPWLDESTCLTVRFEDLVGSAGGGNDEKQVETVRAIISHLGIELSNNQIHEIASKAFFKKANTFRKGQIGDWKNHFLEEHKRAFKEVAGEAIIKYGYADGYDW
ncbi:sulfotransferase domain-containing protein [Oxynema aestuarii]|jgi:hypothetical protein|uniref:Sulfotransferase domain-containing protein n=1 Tax=Oxynema aestuarii AP17 TaxID=2064643 RepID=A0A6H1U4E0_9CYAN|nr:sulfotransferase domain-containing protein [Oxynema aestuarii]QIZ72489.1 sulfotransferase domain-containing protein [Oxynema aestuarii AP17]